MGRQRYGRGKEQSKGRLNLHEALTEEEVKAKILEVGDVR